MERSSDPIDVGSDLAETERQHRLEEQRRKAVPKQIKADDGSWPQTECEECGDEIGTDRLEATGAITCVFCQELIEKKGRNYRG